MENGILNQEYSHMLANAIDHRSTIEHQERINTIVGEQELQLVKTWGLEPYKDGNMWCVLLGDNIQEGICGFGKTPYKAILDFNGAFHRAEKPS